MRQNNCNYLKGDTGRYIPVVPIWRAYRGSYGKVSPSVTLSHLTAGVTLETMCFGKVRYDL